MCARFIIHLALLCHIERCFEFFNSYIFRSSSSFHILVTSRDSGIIETIPNTISLHSLKKEAYASRLNEPGRRFTLHDYFRKVSSWNYGWEFGLIGWEWGGDV